MNNAHIIKADELDAKADMLHASLLAPSMREDALRAEAALLRAGCGCPDDCNCRKPWRMTYCGCKAH